MLEPENLLPEENDMSDYIFKRYEEYRDKCDALTKELEALKDASLNHGESGMTDYQFKCFIELYDERTALREENEALRKKCEALTQELNSLKK